ncbi:hypothetical protein PCA31118_04404 [Pandoraea captiosa]|uniref:Uncharacterized protein n=1 Tax=Pandoraea captiosa TaxID=2508302 RepID=A0A5E5AJ09_9BURK|nr:hypothetical protein [Pandoraea captiosa]VVE73046.1 hypothetical protein PCA31118_04404 [Pandoraea captiosa]
MTVKRKSLLRTDNKAASLTVPAKRTSESGPLFEPDPPVIDPDALADRQNVPENIYPFNVIKTTLKDQPINFTAKMEVNYTPGYRYIYEVDGKTDGVEYEFTDEDFDNETFTFAVQPLLLTHGLHALQYATRPEYDPNFSNLSRPFYFVCDFAKPTNLGEGEVPPEVEENGLTDSILTDLNDVLPLTLPSWIDMFYMDVVVGIVRQKDGANHELPPVTLTYPRDLSDPVVLEFPRDLLETVGDGLLEFTYKVTDMAGNESDEANIKVVEVFISGAIDDLEPPEVPAQEVDGLITEEDAREPVVVQIPGHLSVVPGMKIVVTWGDTALPGVVFDGDNTEEFMLEVDAPYAAVSAEWEANKDAGGFADIEVNYIVFTPEGREAGRPDTPKRVRVNLSQGGGVDPDPETPENEALGKPVVRHSAWQDPEQEDFIPDASVEVDHKIVIPWFVRDELGNVTDQDAFVAGDEILFVYNGEPAGAYTVGGGDVVNKDDLVRPLAWGPVKAGGSGLKDVQYIVERTLVDGSVNTALSPVTVVTVRDSGDLPGGPGPLPEAAFNDAIITWEKITEINNGFAPLTIPVYPNQKLEDIVRIHVLCNRWKTGEPDGDPIPLAEYGGEDGVNEVPGFPFELVITPTNIGKPLTFAWPQAVIEHAWALARARVLYKVTRGDDDTMHKETTDGARSIVELGNMPKPPDPARGAATAKRHRPTMAEALEGVGTSSAKARLAALRKYVGAWRTTSSQRRDYLAMKKLREEKLRKAVKMERRIDDPHARRIAQIAARPTPDPFKKE